MGVAYVVGLGKHHVRPFLEGVDGSQGVEFELYFRIISLKQLPVVLRDGAMLSALNTCCLFSGSIFRTISSSIVPDLWLRPMKRVINRTKAASK